jgi:hypothetical protein
MRREWLKLYEDILAHNEDGSRAFPDCPDADHGHHDLSCPHCAEPKPPVKPKKKKDTDTIKPILPCETANLAVKVTDEYGNAIEGADVFADELGMRVTDIDGLAEFGEVEPGVYDIVASKPGHAPARNTYKGYDEAPATDVPANKTTFVELIQHPLYANVAKFEGTTNGPNKYFGFDHKTNMAAATTDNYWDPIPSHGDISNSSKTKRDGARWVSVAVGDEAEVEIEFDFKDGDCLECIQNSSFEVSPANVAEVVTQTIDTKKAIFKIKGKAEGEASLKVICDGHEIGWFHIWCKPWVTIDLDVGCILTNNTSSVAFSTAEIQSVCNTIYRQAAIRFNVKSIGEIDLTSNMLVLEKERDAYDWELEFFTPDELVLSWLHIAADVSLSELSPELARPEAYRIYFYIPTQTDLEGGVINIGGSPAFIFLGPSPQAYHALAHELGHSLGLVHPLHDNGAGQFPAHLISSIKNPIKSQDATNTEIAAWLNTERINIMADDPLNLMGYWPTHQENTRLRYNQWKAIKRK